MVLPPDTDATILYASDAAPLPERIALRWQTPDGRHHQQTVEVSRDLVPKGSRLVTIRLDLGADNRWEVSVDRDR